MRSRLPVILAAITVALWACSGSATTTPGSADLSSTGASSPPSASVTVYAASSLKSALTRVQTVYRAANPSVTLTISTDSSSSLETRIEQGAPADVFLSADMSNPQKLVDAGLASGRLTWFAGNLLTVIVPTANPAGIRTPADLAKSGVKVVAAGDSVPITRYAGQLIANLARQPGYPSDFVARYAANVVSKEDNVAAVVTKVGLGEGDAGVVYGTDAKSSDRVTAIAIPDAANIPAAYGGVVVKASANQAAAQAFLAWLAGRDGQAVLASFGFLPPGD